MRQKRQNKQEKQKTKQNNGTAKDLKKTTNKKERKEK